MINTKEEQVFLISVLSILVIFSVNVFFVLTLRNIEGNLISEEIFPILANGLILIPAILGLTKSKKWETNKSITIYFIVYSLISIGGLINAIIANDPLAAGLPIVIIVLPFVILFIFHLIVFEKRILKNSKHHNNE